MLSLSSLAQFFQFLVKKQPAHIQDYLDFVLHLAYTLEKIATVLCRCLWRRFNRFCRNINDFHDLVNNESHGSGIYFHHNDTGPGIILPVREIEAGPDVHSRNNPAAQIDYTFNEIGHFRQFRYGLDADNLGDMTDLYAILLPGYLEGKIFVFLGILIII